MNLSFISGAERKTHWHDDDDDDEDDDDDDGGGGDDDGPRCRIVLELAETLNLDRVW